jgi:hypothetical protein
VRTFRLGDPADRSYNDALHRRDDGLIEHLGAVAAQAKA